MGGEVSPRADRAGTGESAPSEDRARRRVRRREMRAARRAERARERVSLKHLPPRERFGVWWGKRPLGTVFTLYLVVYLAAATALSLGAIELSSAMNNGYAVLEVTLEDGTTRHGVVDSGPYIYDAQSGSLLPASELDLPGDRPFAVFIAADDGGAVLDGVPESERAIGTLPATMDMVRNGQVQLHDWGLNYNDAYPQNEVLEVNGSISADKLPEYDRISREGRVQSIEMFDQMTGADLEATFGEGRVSNTAYYAASQRPASILPWLLMLATGLAPVLAYGGLGWIAFRRFYRVHISQPLDELGAAADRIAGGDLDFAIAPVRGRELGRLSDTLENMRAALLESQRELWRTAEGRRRLNAAFAHDMRTPVTVLKGTVEMARMRLERGGRVDARELETLATQVARLERYATAMGGLTKLEDRPVEREQLNAGEVVRELREHAADVVAARGEGMRLVCEPSDGAATVRADALDDVVLDVDLPLVEEVLDNLLSNACGHAEGVVVLQAGVCAGELIVRVVDDGHGFSPEALRRGCDPFYSENKSAEHFGLGLNVSSVLCGLHGGALTLANDEGNPYGGASVTATFAV